jgi:Ser/Thr protein kinase RdoA (MazF antagonist)
MLGMPAAASAVRSTGAILGKLHRSDVEWSQHHSRLDELAVVAQWLEAAERFRPDLGPGLRRGMAVLRSIADRAPDGTTAPSHRDFFDKQVLVSGPELLLLDLDTACRAEPELDLGNFLAHLRLRELQGVSLDVHLLRDAFLDGYSSSGQPHRQRLRFYEASALLRLACVYALRPAWRDLPGSLVEHVLESD